ncbi:MAG TPA: ABC transporter substrate-binding protein [Chloroflexota bacterium]|jgi:NitT/TauT family transport system substrate-binding protein
MLMHRMFVVLMALFALGACRAPSPAPPAAASASGSSPTAAAAPAGGSDPTAATVAPPASPVPLDKLKLTYPAESMGSLPVFAARDRGFFARNGLDVETLFITSERAMAAVASGEIHYVGGVGGASVAASVAGLPLRAVWVAASSPPYVIFARSEITTVEGLRGKRLGLSGVGGTVPVVAEQALKHYGLDLTHDLVSVQIAGSDALRLEAMRAGAIDATPLTAPQSLTARQGGFTPLVNAAEVVQMPLGGLSVSLATLTGNREQVRRVVRALDEAQQWLLQNREEAVALVMAALQTDRATAEGTYDESAPTFQGKGLVSREGIENILQNLRDGGRIGPDARYEDVADGSVAEEAGRDLGLLP